MFALHGKITKSGFTVKTRRNLCLVWCTCKTRYLPMFCVNCQIPRCVLTWVFGCCSLCYNVLYEPCDGFSDLLPVLLVFYATLGGLLFNLISNWYLCF